ncbi:uncharacterized protein C11orf91 homolog [Pteropus medius]|nr:uncharacterized protein C11orf91 homolog [Pteropus giganteus]
MRLRDSHSCHSGCLSHFRGAACRQRAWPHSAAWPAGPSNSTYSGRGGGERLGPRSPGAWPVEPQNPGDVGQARVYLRGVPPTQPPIQKMPKGRRGSQSPTMSQRPAPPLYFPSLYDRGISSSPLSDFNIWKKLFVPLKAGGAPAGGVLGGRPLLQAPPAPAPPPPPGLGPPRERPCPPPWPSGLASIPYEPLRFFYSPPPGPEVAASTLAPGPTTPWLASASHPEELCELEIRIKELELLTITGDGFDSQRYKFLKALKDEKLQGLKTRQPGKKSASLS